MFQIFTKTNIPALGNKMLIDVFSHYSNIREDMTKFKKAFDTNEEYMAWLLNNCGFNSKEAAIKWIDKFGKKDEEYYILETYARGK